MWTEKNNIGSMNPMSNPNLRHANPVAPRAAIQYTTSIHINTFHKIGTPQPNNRQESIPTTKQAGTTCRSPTARGKVRNNTPIERPLRYI